MCQARVAVPFSFALDLRVEQEHTDVDEEKGRQKEKQRTRRSTTKSVLEVFCEITARMYRFQIPRC